MPTLVYDIDIERQALDLELKCGYETAANRILGYLQRGHIWDQRFGWDGEENTIGIHENYVTKICEILWVENQVIAYHVTVNQVVYCSKMQWAQWTAENPALDNLRLQFK